MQQSETEIDFVLGCCQWRGNAHDPFGRTGADDVGAQSEFQRVVRDRIRKRACRVLLAPGKRSEFDPKEQAPARALAPHRTRRAESTRMDRAAV